MKASGYSPDEGGSQYSSQGGNRSPFRKRAVWKKLAAGAVALATAFGGMGFVSSSASASTDRDSYTDTVANSTFETAREKYGLTKHMKNGAILHAWMWSFKNITANMEAIAKAGYTSVQTEPMSKIKYVPSNGKKFDENWYYVYQPSGTSIGNFVVGTEDDLKEMTATAHRYGVRIIVDVVANHFTSDWNAIEPDWQKKEYFHNRNNCPSTDQNPGGGDKIDYSNRWQVTQCHLLGLWDLNTQNQEVADRMQSYLKTAVADGVDGFRFDAAKHVELPDELENAKSNYWNTILKNGAQFQYGEVLQGDSGLNYEAYADMFRDNSSDGGGNTASAYGGTVRAAISSGNLSTKMVQNISTGGADEDQLVTWVESHDNYANKEQTGSDGVKKGVSTELTDYELMMGWAIVGSRKAGAPLYFNRPKESGGKDQNGNIRPQFAEKSQLGDTGDDMWKDKSVVAVNHFRNAMDGKSEYLQNCGDKSCLMIERFTKDKQANDGVTIANMGGEQNLAGMSTNLDDGTYPDEVNGGKLVVKNGKIESGTAKANSVSVFYIKGKILPYVSAEPASINFSTDNVKVTLHAVYASNLKYTTSEGKTGTFQDGDVISVGDSLSVGQSATITVTGVASKTVENVQQGTALSNTVTVNKVDVPPQNLAAQYNTNKVGNGVKKTINFNAGKGASISDWDSSMLIAQGAANDDPRVYRPNSMYEVPIDLYALYGAYDDDNLYLMWEMTNVQDVVDRGDDYPLSQGHLWQTQNLPFHIAIDTKDDSTRIGNNGGLQTGGSLWASNITWGGEQKLNNVVTISTNGSNGPWIYKGDETGLNANAAYGPAANAKTNTKKTGIKFGYGNGILSKDVIGIDGGWGDSNGRFVGDMKSENQSKAKWVNFNDKGHDSAGMDDHYEIAIPLDELGTTAERIEKSGIGIELAATFGLSAMDSLPYDLAMNDNADLPDTTSQVNNSYEKSDDDMFTVKMANIGGDVPPDPTTSIKIDQSDYTADLSKGVTTKQLTATTDPKGNSVSWSSSDKSVATVSSKGVVTPVKAGTAKITAKSGDKTDSITVTVIGEIPPDPIEKNTIYAAKPSGWGDLYAYVYTGDGATAVNNAAWPGVKMTATTATDGCHQSNAYKYVVPTNLAKDAKVIFNDGGSQQLPGSREPGITYNGGIVKWDGATAALPALDCPTDVPVTSVSVSGSGVSGGKLSLKKGASAQLSATVSPSNATDRTVAWSSSNAAVASVDKSGKVTGVKAGTAKVTAKAGGRTAVVEVTVEDVPSPARPMTVYYKAPSSWKSVKANYRVFSSPQQAASGAKLEQYCDGWWRLTIADTKGAKVKVAFTDGRSWDDNSGKYYYASGSVMAVSGGEVSSSAPSCQSSEKQPMTVWYKAPSSWSTVKANWRVYSSPQQSGSKAQLTRACDGWWRLTIADTKGAKVKVAFTDGRSWDDNGGKYYYATGSSMAVAGGQFIGDVTPVCAAEETPDVPVTSVTLSGTGVSSGKASIKKGASLQLTATVNPSNATDKTVTWKSSNTAVATVSNGKVTGVKAGTATITAKAGDKTASVAVTVTDTPSGLTIVGSTHSVAPETMQFTVSGLPDNANANWIEWSVTGDHLRATNNPGRTFKVFGTAATTGVVTVSYLDQTASVPITVDAYSYESAPTITVDKQSLNMKVGDSVKINYTISPASNPFKLAVFDSFNDDVVFADGDGTLHATGTGSTTVRVWSSRSTNYTDIKVTVS